MYFCLVHVSAAKGKMPAMVGHICIIAICSAAKSVASCMGQCRVKCVRICVFVAVICPVPKSIVKAYMLSILLRSQLLFEVVDKQKKKHWMSETNWDLIEMRRRLGTKLTASITN